MNEIFSSELGVERNFDTSCNALLITGPNASGKSFLRRWIQQYFRLKEIECINLSQEGRSVRWAGSCFVYGSEQDESTGYISAGTLTMGMRTSRAREKSHIVLWDEPEIGMGEELQLGSAIWMREQLENFPKHLLGVIFMTHSRLFVKEIMKMDNAKFYNLSEHKTMNEWMNREIVPVSPEKIQAIGLEKWRKLDKLLEENRKRKKK